MLNTNVFSDVAFILANLSFKCLEILNRIHRYIATGRRIYRLVSLLTFGSVALGLSGMLSLVEGEVD